MLWDDRPKYTTQCRTSSSSLLSDKTGTKKQNGAIVILMFRQWCYTKEDVESYLQNGLLPWIVAECYQNYFNLLGAIRQLPFDHDIWEGGPAKAMLDFHSSRLLQVQRYALS
jgi:hypothetical protein